MLHKADAKTSGMGRWHRRRHDPVPGRLLTVSATLLYVSALIVLPLVALSLRAFADGAAAFWSSVTAPRVVASLRLSLGLAIAAASINLVFGSILAYVLARYRFPGRRLVDALIDLPYALPTAVAGLALTALYSERGWLGAALTRVGVEVAFTPLGILVALIFIGLPFQVRILQPLLAGACRAQEEAGATLGASAWQRFYLILLPSLVPALLTGFALAFARGIGEYGSVIFIAGNIPMVSEIAPLIIVSKLEQYDYAGAAAVATVLLVISLAVLTGVGVLERRYRHRFQGGPR